MRKDIYDLLDRIKEKVDELERAVEKESVDRIAEASEHLQDLAWLVRQDEEAEE